MTKATVFILLNILFFSRYIFAQAGFDNYKNYDFITGENILFEDNIGYSSPSNWVVKGGEIISSEGQNESAIQINKYYTILAPDASVLPDGSGFFTIEFDTYLDSKYEGNPGIFINFNSGDEPKATLGTLANYTQFDIGSLNNRGEHPKQINYNNYYDKWHHYAVSYSPGNISVYVDEYKIIDLNNTTLGFDNITVCGNSTEGMIMSFKNFRLTNTDPGNLSSKLPAQEKVITHGFIFNWDNTLKPESMGTLNAVYKAMKENPDLKIEICAYSDKPDALSEKITTARAENIRSVLVKMGIDKTRLTAKGYGGELPINSNSANTEKANNRRVEFKKIQ